MIKNLKLKNFILFNEENVNFTNNSNSLVGESGAGKSLIFKAIQVMTGNRNDKSLIMKNKDYYEIELTYDISRLSQNTKLEIKDILNNDFEDEIVFYRRLDQSGKGQIRINGVLVTLADLKEVMSLLIDIHEQNSSDEILNRNNQNDLIDKLVNEELKVTYNEEYKKFKKLKDQKENLEIKSESKDDDLEILNFKIDKLKEIQNIEPEEVLENKLNSIKDVVKKNKDINQLQEFANKANRNLADLHTLSNEVELDEAIQNKINNIYDLMEDLSFDLSKNDNYEVEEDADLLMDQISEIRKLKRKYNLDYEGLVSKYNELIAERNQINEIEDELVRVNSQFIRQKELVQELANDLSKGRNDVISKITKEINESLHDLQMNEAEIKFDIQQQELDKYGNETINFLIKTNKGYDFAPLNEIASGGEKSRIMLIIKKVFAQNDEIKVLLLDEIDQGVSSGIAQKIGEMIIEMANQMQIILISHTPQVLAKVDSLIEVKKNNDAEQTYSNVRKLSKIENEELISKMLQL